MSNLESEDMTKKDKQSSPRKRLAGFRLHNVAILLSDVLTLLQLPVMQSCSETRWPAGTGKAGGGSGEVHGPQCVVVNLNRLSQRLGVPSVTLP